MAKRIIVGFICFVLAGVAGFFGLEFYKKTGLFKKPGQLVFSESFLDSEAEMIRESLKDIELDSDLTFSYSLFDSARSSDSEGKMFFLADVFVPVDDFYSPNDDISSSEFEQMYGSGGSDVISVSKLDSSRKLLSVDGNYFLDNFTSGGKFKYLVVEGKQADLDKIKTLLGGFLQKVPGKSDTLSFVQTGVTAFGRGMNTKMNEVGNGEYFVEEIADFLQRYDFTHTSSESSFSDSASGSNICSDWRFVDAFLRAGIDIVELTGNHNVDCGADDAIATIDKYDELNIKTVGGGRNASEAERPLTINQKGNKVTMLAYNESTGGATTGEEPGANRYSEDDARTRIAEAKERGDIVIVDVQYFECSSYDTTYENMACDRADSSEGDQIGLFRQLIDFGADVVVGTSAHQTQTFESYKDGEIYYGLGNIFFDQIWWPGTTRSLGLVHYFWNGKLIQTKRFGTVYDESYQTRLMSEDELSQFIERLNQSRPE
ncbi:CapA family protein [Candidatus Saccharibacteria bacterium]|nr:CapA family protein [Candidatus Saccharibacteria bacterium]